MAPHKHGCGLVVRAAVIYGEEYLGYSRGRERCVYDGAASELVFDIKEGQRLARAFIGCCGVTVRLVQGAGWSERSIWYIEIRYSAGYRWIVSARSIIIITTML